MKRKDVHGNPIYQDTWEKMLHYSQELKKLGFKESKNKPNLFYRKLKDGVVFADFRGKQTSKIGGGKYIKNPIWSEGRKGKPNIYFKDVDSKTKKSFLIALKCLDIEINEYPRTQDQCRHGSNKYKCLICQHIKQKKTKRETYQNTAQCYCCQQKLLADIHPIEHHTSYNPEKTILVCSSCHRRIHNEEGFFDYLQPNQKRPIDLDKKKKKVDCPTCNKKMLVPIEWGEEDIIENQKVCYRCNEERERWLEPERFFEIKSNNS